MADLDGPGLLTRIRLQDPDNPWLPNAVGPTLARTAACTRCDLHRRMPRHVCIEGQGPAGAPLLVMPSPTEHDDAAGKFVMGGVNAIVASAVRKHAPEFRVAWAVSCPSGRDPTLAQVEACRPYLANEFAARPPRAVLLGPVAAEAATGYPFWADRTRRAWAWVRGVPCFFVLDPKKAGHNGHHKTWLQEDLAWALTTPLQAPPDGEVRVLLEPAEARAWFEALEPRKLLAFDTEYHPKHKWAPGEFKVLCASFCQEVGAPAAVPGDLLAHPEVLPAFKRVMEDPRIPKVAQDLKNDRHVLWRAYGVDVAGMEWDTLKVAGLVESEAPKGLGPQSWKVGMGGYKVAGQVGADDEDDE